MSKSVIYFDGVCNLCNKAIAFIIKHDKDDKFLFCSLQSERGMAFSKLHNFPILEPNSILLDNNIKIFNKSEAVFEIIRFLPSLRLLRVFIFLPKFLSDWFYDIIATNRYRVFGKTDECMIPDNKIKAKFLN